MAIQLTQKHLMEAQGELSTGRYYDLGLELGGRIGSSIGLRLKLTDLQQAEELATQASVKAGVAQSTLGSIGELAASFQSTLLGARTAPNGQELVQNAAHEALQTLTGLVNTTFDGRYLFGGINTETAPLGDFLNGPPQAAMDATFLSYFGMSQQDPAVLQIAGLDMKAFIDGPLADMFAPAAWKADWSNATDGNLLQRAADGTALDVAFNANTAFVVKLAEAFSMMAGLGQGNLSASAFEETVDKALALVVGAQRDIGDEQSHIGISQQTLASASTSNARLQAAAAEAIRALESVDPYEAATSVNTLMTQLESSYAVTARISRLSLLNYI